MGQSQVSVVLKAPNNVPEGDYSSDWPKIFLAGSIDMGKAENWQERLERELEEHNVIIYNPRRDDWDSSWVQDISNPQFKEQVEWELDHINDSDLVLFYFDPNGPAPITLMELGYVIGNEQWCLVCCPEGYWRRGNVQVMTQKHVVPMVDDIESFIAAAKRMVIEMENNYGF